MAQGFKRSILDRRLDQDRRKGYAPFEMDRIIDLFGHDRREKERRVLPEKRKGWIRTSDWSSECIDYPPKYIMPYLLISSLLSLLLFLYIFSI